MLMSDTAVAFAPSLPRRRSTTRRCPASDRIHHLLLQHHVHRSQHLSVNKDVVSPVVMHGMIPGSPYLRRAAGTVVNRTPIAALMLAAVMVGYLLGKRSGSASRVSNMDTFEGLPFLSPANIREEGVTPIWLNYGIARLWSLFQKSTKRLTKEVLQPILDSTEKPDFVKDVRLVKFVPGARSPSIRSLRRLPSRALAEVQYSLRALFSSTSEFYFEADVALAGQKIALPVTVKNMDAVAHFWAAFSLAPYEPYCTGVQYALLENPKISFDMDIAGMLPITAVPVLRNFFFRVICEELPKEFMFPKTVSLDFTPAVIREGKSVEARLKIRNMDSLSLEEMKHQFPEQWALFDVLDLNNDGSLSGVELYAGLKDWGYTAGDASETFERLDLDGDESVSFAEFCKMWPSLAASFVPSYYQGLLTTCVRGANNLRMPRLGSPDPYVRLTLTGADAVDCGGKQEACTKRDSLTSGGDSKPGNPVWNEVFELNCCEPAEEVLEVHVQEASRLTLGGRGKNRSIGRATVPLKSLRQSPNQQLSIKLEPQGSIDIDLSYADFVDRRESTTLTPEWTTNGDSKDQQQLDSGVDSQRGRVLTRLSNSGVL